jgi:hypothetical protein
MVLRLYVAVLAFSVGAMSISCTPTSQMPAPDVTVVTSDAGNPCDIADAISQARLIRNPDGGQAIVVPCPQ